MGGGYNSKKHQISNSNKHTNSKQRNLKDKQRQHQGAIIRNKQGDIKETSTKTQKMKTLHALSLGERNLSVSHDRYKKRTSRRPHLFGLMLDLAVGRY